VRGLRTLNDLSPDSSKFFPRVWCKRVVSRGKEREAPRQVSVINGVTVF